MLKHFGNGGLTLPKVTHFKNNIGGEPLLSKDTWKVMDELIENPNQILYFV